MTTVGLAGSGTNYKPNDNDEMFSPYIFITASSFTDDSVANYIAHEVGHILGLFHTFEGLYDNKISNNTCTEKCKASVNSYMTGDFIKDTTLTSSA